MQIFFKKCVKSKCKKRKELKSHIQASHRWESKYVSKIVWNLKKTKSQKSTYKLLSVGRPRFTDRAGRVEWPVVFLEPCSVNHHHCHRHHQVCCNDFQSLPGAQQAQALNPKMCSQDSRLMTPTCGQNYNYRYWQHVMAKSMIVILG